MLKTTQNERTTHEFRIQGEIGERFQFTAGAFFDDVETNSQGAFQYFGAIGAGFDVAVTPGNGFVEGVNNPNGRNLPLQSLLTILLVKKSKPLCLQTFRLM